MYKMKLFKVQQHDGMTWRDVSVCTDEMLANKVFEFIKGKKLVARIVPDALVINGINLVGEHQILEAEGLN